MPASERIADDLAAAFWEGCASHELRLQLCKACANWQFYPRYLCSHCGSRDVTWELASGEATLESYSVVRRSGGEFATMVPYVVAIVRLSEGPTMMTNIVQCAEPDLRIGMALRVRYEQRGGDVLPMFAPETGADSPIC